MTFFSFPVAKSPDTEDPKLSDALQPIYTAFTAIYNSFVYSCGVVEPPSSEFVRLAESNASSCQPQNLNRLYLKASEDILAGELVSIHSVGGLPYIKKAAGGAANIVAHGYAITGAAAGEIAALIVGTGLAYVRGATVGQRYYLSTVPGAYSTTVPGSGLQQFVGLCIIPDFIYVSCF